MPMRNIIWFDFFFFFLKFPISKKCECYLEELQLGVSINLKYCFRACVEVPLPGMFAEWLQRRKPWRKKGMKSRAKSTTSFLRQPTRRNFANVVIMARQPERSFVSELPKNKRSYHPAFPLKNSPYLSYPLDIVPRKFFASIDPEYEHQPPCYYI